MPRILDLDQIHREIEFEEQGEGNSVNEIMKKAKADTEKM